MDKEKRLLLILGCIMAAALFIALGLSSGGGAPQLQAAQLLPQAKPLPAFQLKTANGVFGPDQFQSHWNLVFFGYTACADVCPLELQKLGQLLKQYDDSSDSRKFQVVFISVDPERDTPDTLVEYVRFFHPGMIGATADNASLAQLAGFFGAPYNRMASIDGKDYLVQAGADMPNGAGQHYLVNHSSRIFIVDPRGRYIGSFPPPHDIAILSADLQELIHH